MGRVDARMAVARRHMDSGSAAVALGHTIPHDFGRTEKE
jgi:hypothetical protein